MTKEKSTKRVVHSEGGFFRDLFAGIGREFGVSLRWALGGGVAGALLAGGAIAYNFGFDFKPILMFAVVGGVVGAIAAWLFYFHATSF